jgi:hypothetical protein
MIFADEPETQPPDTPPEPAPQEPATKPAAGRAKLKVVK